MLVVASSFSLLIFFGLGFHKMSFVLPIPRYLFPSSDLESFQPQFYEVHFDLFHSLLLKPL